MNKILLAATVAIGAILVSDIAHAAPKHHHVVKHYKHHKVKKHIDKVKPVAAIVDPEHNAYARCAFLDLFCAPKTTPKDPPEVVMVIKEKKQEVIPARSAVVNYDPSPYTTSSEESAAEFFRKDKERMAGVTHEVINENKVALSTEEKRKVVAKGCSWFACQDEASAVVASASDWLGKEAKKDKQALKKLFKIEWDDPIDPQHVAWCAAFANAILRRENQPTTHSLMARSFLNWGKVTHDPKQGDIVVLARGHSKYAGHVGFFMGYEWFEGVKYVKVLGGNTDHAVQVGYFPASKVVGYRTYV